MSATMGDTWRFNRDYEDRAQVEPFYDAYLEAYDEVTADGGYPYNDCFKGRIPGIEGPDEDAAIYLLQGLKRLREMESRLAEYLADGFEPIERLDTVTKFAWVVHYGFYTNGTGWQEWADARLVPHDNGTIRAVLPKGRRTNGYQIWGHVIVKRAA